MKKVQEGTIIISSDSSEAYPLSSLHTFKPQSMPLLFTSSSQKYQLQMLWRSSVLARDEKVTIKKILPCSYLLILLWIKGSSTICFYLWCHTIKLQQSHKIFLSLSSFLNFIPPVYSLQNSYPEYICYSVQIERMVSHELGDQLYNTKDDYWAIRANNSRSEILPDNYPGKYFKMSKPCEEITISS